MSKKLLNLFGLKWNPFIPSIPLEGVTSFAKIDTFCYRVENLVMDGGYAMITGDVGTGKSVALRILANKLEQIPEVNVGVLSRPQSGVADFYREIGDLFGVELRASNRWGGHKALRKRWLDHIQTTLFRPVLLIDEAQDMFSVVLNELRILMSTNFDSEMILTVVLCGDERLPEKLKAPDLKPIDSRIRARLLQENASKEELEKMLKEVIVKAGNGTLLSKGLIDMLVDHASGNCRAMMLMAEHLLEEGMAKEVDQLDEKLFFEINTSIPKTNRKKNVV